jgi:hypothetical protein
MTAETTIVSVDVLDAALAEAAGSLGEDEQRLAAALLRLLADGQPASVPAAARLGYPNQPPGRCCGPGPQCSATTRSG